jgi:hypothetical protein
MGLDRRYTDRDIMQNCPISQMRWRGELYYDKKVAPQKFDAKKPVNQKILLYTCYFYKTQGRPKPEKLIAGVSNDSPQDTHIFITRFIDDNWDDYQQGLYIKHDTRWYKVSSIENCNQQSKRIAFFCVLQGDEFSLNAST